MQRELAQSRPSATGDFLLLGDGASAFYKTLEPALQCLLPDLAHEEVPDVVYHVSEVVRHRGRRQ